MARKQSRASRWQDAIGRVREVMDEQQTLVSAAQAETQTALSNLQDAKQVAQDAMQEAMQDLIDVRDEYQEWYDNLPENLQGNSPVSEKLEAVTELDLEVELDLDEVELEEVDWSETESLLDEAEGVDLPLGFGRD